MNITKDKLYILINITKDKLYILINISHFVKEINY